MNTIPTCVLKAMLEVIGKNPRVHSRTRFVKCYQYKGDTMVTATNGTTALAVRLHSTWELPDGGINFAVAMELAANKGGTAYVHPHHVDPGAGITETVHPINAGMARQASATLRGDNLILLGKVLTKLAPEIGKTPYMDVVTRGEDSTVITIGAGGDRIRAIEMVIAAARSRNVPRAERPF